MSTLLSVILLAGIALFGASRRFYRVRRSRPMVILVSGGWIYAAVGAAIGPFGLRALSIDEILSLTPLIAVALGWVGLMIGLQLRFAVLRVLPRQVHRVGVSDTLASIVLFGGIGALGLVLWADDASWAGLLPAIAAIAAISIGWSMETRSLQSGDTAEDTTLASLLRAAGALAAMASVILAGLLTAATVRSAEGAPLIAGGAFGVRLLLAGLMAVAAAIIGRHAAAVAGSDSPDVLTVFLGLIALIAGAATAIGFSPILAAFFAGVVIANLPGPHLRRFERFILEAEHVIAAVLAILAGAILDPRVGVFGLTLALAIAAARFACKPMLLRRVAGLEREANAPTRSLLALAPARQSPIAIPIAVALVLAEPSVFHQRVLAVIVFAGIFSALPLIVLAARNPAPTTTTTTPSPAAPAEEEQQGTPESNPETSPDAAASPPPEPAP